MQILFFLLINLIFIRGIIFGGIYLIYILIFYLLKKRTQDTIALIIFISLSGIITGIWLYLVRQVDGLLFAIEPLGWGAGELISDAAESIYVDVKHAFYLSEIPWIFRTPQVYLYSSAIVWYLLGMGVYTVVHFTRKISSPFNWKAVWVTLIVLIVTVAAACGIAYANASEAAKHGTTRPQILGPGGGFPPHILSEYPVIDSWEVESISLSKSVVRVGDSLRVDIGVKNTGSKTGIQRVELVADGSSWAGNVLLGGERDVIEVYVMFPRPGTYTVRSGQFSETVEVVKRK